MVSRLSTSSWNLENKGMKLNMCVSSIVILVCSHIYNYEYNNDDFTYFFYKEACLLIILFTRNSSNLSESWVGGSQITAMVHRFSIPQPPWILFLLNRLAVNFHKKPSSENVLAVSTPSFYSSLSFIAHFYL